MPDVLALRLGAPLQSWGGHSRHTTRGTLTHPTKSGVVGLCASALGRPRGSDLGDLSSLGFGVRIDRPGTLLIDFHTVSAASHAPLDPREQRLPTSGGGRLKAGEGKVSRRSYLQDAVFVAVLEADQVAQSNLLEQVEAALERPRYPLFLGRRSCPPDRKVLLGLYRDTTIIETLAVLPWQGRSKRHAPRVLPVVVDDPSGGELLPDLPVSSPAFQRSFADRPVRHTDVPTPGLAPPSGPVADTAPLGSGSLFSGDSSMALLEEGDL
ncbi:type I-E CRISPR-associated protein Cas5/CasD [Nocardiopsis sp. NPDC101807]|uniref:type I-E CRISPR-associated protein Cas5/CasD n=1 Tax=Nocardiopsis sp. NPDC101807 TaxID=3364339 RepID=UPI0038088DC1